MQPLESVQKGKPGLRIVVFDPEGKEAVTLDNVSAFIIAARYVDGEKGVRATKMPWEDACALLRAADLIAVQAPMTSEFARGAAHRAATGLVVPNGEGPLKLVGRDG